MAPVKAVLLTEIMSPYRIPVLNRIAEDKRVDFQVVFLAEMAGERKWTVDREQMKFSHEVIPGFGIPFLSRFPIFFNPGVFKKLCQIRPDVVICGGYQHPSFFLAFLYARLFQKKFFLWCETHALSVRIKHVLATWYRKCAIRSASGYLVPGTLSFDFLRSLGASSKKIYKMPNAVDNDFFHRGAKEFRAHREAVKKKRGFPKHLILYVGRFISAKGLDVLFRAFERLPPELDAGLLMIGDGPDEKRYREYCRKKNLNVFFEGFKQQEELPLYYGISDLLVLPSQREEWGLVLNEAMASGLPVIASDQVGAGYDLIQNGVNGFQFPALDDECLSCFMNQILSDEALRRRMGSASVQIASGYSPEQSARGFFQAVLNEREPAQERPFISIVMPSYQQGRFIRTAIESVLNQGYARLECLVVDAGSTDETHEILKDYREWVRVIHVPGGKQSEVMNKGLDMSRGDIIAFLNADDAYSPGALSRIVERFQEKPEIDMIYGDFQIIDQDSAVLSVQRDIAFHKPSYLFLGRFITYPTVFFRRRAALKAGKMDLHLDHAMDYDYWLRILAQGGVIEHLPVVLSSFRWHPLSKSVIFGKEAHQEYESIRGRYQTGVFFKYPVFRFAANAFFWCFYKIRRVALKLFLGKYWSSPPQPFLFYFWRKKYAAQQLNRAETQKDTYVITRG